MGLFDYFTRRRRRESAIPGGTPESLTRQLKGDGEPIGQPIGQALPGAGQEGAEITAATDLAGIVSMVQEAFKTGDIQVTQGESQVIDLRGSGLRDQIIGALEQYGVDTETPGTQIDASSVPGLQEQIMRALEDAGVDVEAAGGDPEA